MSAAVKEMRMQSLQNAFTVWKALGDPKSVDASTQQLIDQTHDDMQQMLALKAAARDVTGPAVVAAPNRPQQTAEVFHHGSLNQEGPRQTPQGPNA